VRERLAAAFAKRDDPYAGTDLANAGRFGGGLWFLGAVFTAALLPFVHPTHAVGDGGWAIAGGLIAGSIVLGWRMRHMGANLNVDELLLYSYAAIACIAVLSVLVLLPLVYDDTAGHSDRVEMVAQLFVWLALALAAVVLMAVVRAQRLGLRLEGETARRQARLDPLTGLLNRRAFDEDLDAAIERARASAEPLSMVVGDLDDFKDFNDRFGHLEGDRVLEQVAQALRAALRRPDVAYRWGGDEFAVILPQADLTGARLVAKRVEAAIAKHSGPSGEALGITTGVAEFDPAAGGAEALVAAADQALMLGKGSGVFDAPQPRG
jgi:diguanylate cyclase (GGDEF)-like protein